MRTYPCQCGNVLFYDNSLCLNCRREVGFCPACRNIVSLLPATDGGLQCGNPACGVSLTKCANYLEHQVCNRCLTTDSAQRDGLCDCCRFNQTIPDLTVPGNLQRWYALESAKRRLFYELSYLGLPYGTAEDGIDPPLGFDFKADAIPVGNYWRSLGAGEKVYTGHADGLITINIREADHVEREKLRVDLGEAKRTLIGHFRHEIGHYYWEVLIKGRREEGFKALFGEHEHPTYAEALDLYYEQGPAADWSLRCVSAYASMHPWEDFAETWATYLTMINTLDTAGGFGFAPPADPLNADLKAMAVRYQELGIALNEMNRSMGLLDAVPEVLVPAVVEKLQFIHELVLQGRAENGALQPPKGESPPVVNPKVEPAPAGAADNAAIADTAPAPISSV